MENLIEMFDDIIDVRDSRGKKHCITHIIVMAICGILNKSTDFDDIYDYAKAKEKYFNKKLKLWNGIPTAQTFRNVFRVLPAKQFLEIFMNWINNIVEDKTGKQIIIDGKAIRAATEKATGGDIPYIVSGYIADLGLSVGQVKVGDKTNEITAIPELLELLDIEGCIITIDAIGTQTKIMDKIIEKKANFVLPLKENQKGAYEEIKEYFKDIIADVRLRELKPSLEVILESKEKHYGDTVKETKFTYTNQEESVEIYTTYEKGHGRNEQRTYIKSNNVKWFKNKKWKHVKSIVKEIRIRTNRGITTESIKYYVSSLDMPVEELAKICRKHWQIENNLHWVLDMYFFEDLSRVRKDNALENLSIVRKLCYNIIKMDTRYDKANKNGNVIKLSTKRKMNRYSLYPEEFEELLTTVLPNNNL